MIKVPTLVFLTMVLIASQAVGAPSVRDVVGCQKQMGKQARTIAKFIATQGHNCTDKVLRCELAAEIDAVDPGACSSKAIDRCAKVPGKLGTLVAKLREKTIAKCAALELVEAEAFVGGLGFVSEASACAALASPLTPIVVTSIADLVDCQVATTRCAADRELRNRDPRAPDSLVTAGIEAAFPCAAP